LPEGFAGISVGRHPVTVLCGGGVQVGELSYSYRKKRRGAELEVESSVPINLLQARLGPFRNPVDGARLLVNGKQGRPAFARSGDSWWVWVDFGGNVKTASCRLTW